MERERGVNSTTCLPQKPKLVVGLRASTANINAAYRDFLFNKFQVSSVDMESAAIVMTSLSNGFPVIGNRGRTQSESLGLLLLSMLPKLLLNSSKKYLEMFLILGNNLPFFCLGIVGGAYLSIKSKKTRSRQY